MCPEQDVRIFRDEEGVLHVAGRMFRWEIQCRKNVPVILYFRAFGYGITQTGKNFDDLVFN